jgi:hypothetical protein
MKTDNKQDIQKYCTMTVGHPRLSEAIEEVLAAINEAEQGELIFLYGPTGVGKTTLGKRIKSKLNKEFRKELGNSPSIIPVILNEAPFPDGNRFSWIEYYRRALKQLNEPLIDKKKKDRRCSVYAHQHLIDNETLDEFSIGRPPAGHTLRMSFENALKFRKTQVLLIDEAHHIAKGMDPKNLQGQLDYLKSLANLTETVIVLVGTYELLAFIDLSGQLTRRGNGVHLSRYYFDSPKDKQMFFNVLSSFVNKLPLQHDLDLPALLEMFYIRSAGCVGILSSWLKKALKLAMRRGDQVLKLEHVEEKALSLNKLLKITEELEEGEALLKPVDNAELIIRARLGLVSGEVDAPKARKEASKQKSRSGKRVGQRKPTRDPVGVPKAVSP